MSRGEGPAAFVVRRRAGRAPVNGVPTAQKSGLVERRRRTEQRATDLLQQIARLDVESNPAALHRLRDEILADYENSQRGVLLGLFGKCYLGPPYIDHLMTLSGEICKHFTRVDSVPAPYSAARDLAANAAYVFIEVYLDGSVVPIRHDGRPVL